MYVADLELCRFRAPFHSDCWRAPLLGIGWLEHPHAFTRGFATNGLFEKLEQFVDSAEPHFAQYHSRGLHVCSLCDNKTRETRLIPFSFFELLVPGADVIYVAPGAVLHYVKSHYYVPPTDFMDAIEKCPPYGSREFMDALRRANCNEPPPIETYDEYVRSFREAIEAREKQT